MGQEPGEDRTWLLEPPGPGEVQLQVRIGDGVELDESQRAAIETLVSCFYESEVAGYASSAEPCTPEYCRPKHQQCFADMCVDYACWIKKTVGIR